MFKILDAVLGLWDIIYYLGFIAVVVTKIKSIKIKIVLLAIGTGSLLFLGGFIADGILILIALVILGNAELSRT